MKKIINITENIKVESLINIVYTIAVMYIMYFIGTLISSLFEQYIVIPGNIIGMALLFISLKLNIIKYARIKGTVDFLLGHLNLFFIPFGVSIMKYYPLFQNDILYFFLILLVSTTLALSFSMLTIEKINGGNK